MNANDDKKNKEFGYNMVILFVKSDKNINQSLNPNTNLDSF